MSRRYLSETDDEIHERMLAMIDDDIDKRQGSVSYDLTRPTSAELAQAYIELDNILLFGFASDDMPGEFLDLRARELGIIRKPSIKASGELTFTGPIGTVVERGTRVRTDEDDQIYFVTLETTEIGESGSIIVPAEAEDGGFSGNVGAREITVTLGDLSGTVEVINDHSFDGGTDTESDDSFLERYFDRTQKPITSGNVYHYEQWSKEVPGVGDVRVYPLWDGPGTVKVVLLDEEKETPAQSIIDAAITYIEDQRPIGADVTVVGAQEISINISADLILSSNANLENVKSDIERGLTEYLTSLAFNDTLIRYTQIAAILLDVSRIIDYSNLTVNGSTSNVEITEEQVAILGEVEIDEV